jgi:hypothetical protein
MNGKIWEECREAIYYRLDNLEHSFERCEKRDENLAARMKAIEDAHTAGIRRTSFFGAFAAILSFLIPVVGFFWAYYKAL